MKGIATSIMLDETTNTYKIVTVELEISESKQMVKFSKVKEITDGGSSKAEAIGKFKMDLVRTGQLIP